MLKSLNFIIKLTAISSLCIVSVALFLMPLHEALILNGRAQRFIILWAIWTRVYLAARSFFGKGSFNNDPVNPSSSNMSMSSNSSSISSPNYTTDPSYSYMSQNIHNHTNTSLTNSTSSSSFSSFNH